MFVVNEYCQHAGTGLVQRDWMQGEGGHNSEWKVLFSNAFVSGWRARGRYTAGCSSGHETVCRTTKAIVPRASRHKQSMDIAAWPGHRYLARLRPVHLHGTQCLPIEIMLQLEHVQRLLFIGHTRTQREWYSVSAQTTLQTVHVLFTRKHSYRFASSHTVCGNKQQRNYWSKLSAHNS